MIITVKLFAAARDRVGADEVTLELGNESTIADLRASLLILHPQLEAVLGHSAFAVDQRYVDDDYVVGDRHEVACIPPVSGG